MGADAFVGVKQIQQHSAAKPMSQEVSQKHLAGDA